MAFIHFHWEGGVRTGTSCPRRCWLLSWRLLVTHRKSHLGHRPTKSWGHKGGVNQGRVWFDIIGQVIIFKVLDVNKHNQHSRRLSLSNKGYNDWDVGHLPSAACFRAARLRCQLIIYWIGFHFMKINTFRTISFFTLLGVVSQVSQRIPHNDLLLKKKTYCWWKKSCTTWDL